MWSNVFHQKSILNFFEDTLKILKKMQIRNYCWQKNFQSRSLQLRGGFSNADDAAKLGNSDWQDQFARAVARGITDYFE